MKTNDAWLEELTLELRMREVPGTAIGDALAQVRAHLAESGESAEEAFGTPEEYAAELNLPASADSRIEPRWMGRLVASNLLGLAALYLSTPTVVALRQGLGVGISWGMLSSLGVFAAVVVALPAVFSYLFKHLVVLGALLTFAVAALVAFNVLLPWPAFVLPGWASALTVVAALAGSVLVYPPLTADPIVDPTDPAPRVPRIPRFSRWIWVIAAVFLAGLGFLA